MWPNIGLVGAVEVPDEELMSLACIRSVDDSVYRSIKLYLNIGVYSNTRMITSTQSSRSDSPVEKVLSSNSRSTRHGYYGIERLCHR